MPIPVQFQWRQLYHFTHLENLRGLLETGLLCKNEQRRLNTQHRNIAIPAIQRTRAAMQVTCGPGGVVHDYVPFYFCKRSSMLLSVVNQKNCDQQFLIYLAFPITILDNANAVFTDSAANRENDPPNFYNLPEDLRNLNWGIIDSMRWRLDNEQEKQKRMAEGLIHGRVDLTTLSHIIVWNGWVRDRVQDIYRDLGLPVPNIRYDPHHYFTKYPAEPNASLVTGPFFRRLAYDEAVRQVLGRQQQATHLAYRDLNSLLNALRTDLRNIAATAELLGLTTDNPMHRQDVATHTRNVVAGLAGIPLFATLTPQERDLVELAAFLHDVGKGPRARWPGGVCGVDPDHPLNSTSIVKDLLVSNVEILDQEDVAILLKLISYHDLIGDIIGRDRDENQLYEVIRNERELLMLECLSQCDVNAIFGEWWNQQLVDELHQRAVQHLNLQGQN